MSEENHMSGVTDEMRRALREVEQHRFPPKEETLFSISGRGHLENPTSDLLCYFMLPQGQHGFDTCFLRAFFECMNVDWKTLSFKEVNVVPQAQTHDGKWIDLLVIGVDWVLVIENKLHAPLGNPLQSYVEHARRIAANRRFFALLSPQPISASGWESVTYRKYCEALKNTLPKEVFSGWFSKWHVFAREFIVHLENELYDPIMTMTPERKTFVEKNLLGIEELKKLSDRYTADLLSELTQRLRTDVPGHSFQFGDAPWALLSKEDGGQFRVQLMFQTPVHEGGNRGRRFRVGADVQGLNAAQLEKIRNLPAMESYLERPEGGWDTWECSFDSSAEAVNGLCSLAKQLYSLLDSEP